MLSSEQWLDRSSGEEIALCTNFRDELSIGINDEDTLIPGSTSVDPTNLSNNAQKRQICQSYSKLKIPETWYDVSEIKIWPLIILKNKHINKRLNNISIPQQLKNELDKKLEITDTDVGSIIEVELGFKSLKIKCPDIPSRSRLFKFLTTELKDWEIIVPELRNPMIKLNAIKVNPDEKEKFNTWLDKLHKRNGWPEDSAKFDYAFKRNNEYDIVLSITPILRERIQRKFGLVNLGTCLTKASDYFNIKFCTRCCSFGHANGKCKLVTRCGYCGINHYGDCEAKSKPEKQFCHNCMKKGTNVWDKNCPVYRIQLRHELEKTNFNYTMIMQ